MAQEAKVFKARDMRPIPFWMVPVDIVIPFHNEESKVSRLLESIFHFTASNRYAINLVDDCSKNSGYIRQLEKVPGVYSVRNKEQVGFGASVMRGCERGSQPWICVLHSDVVIEDMNWLLRLGQTMLDHKDEGVKLVSARSDNPLTGDERLKAEKGVDGEDLVAEEFLPFYCALFHRDLFKYIGPLKPYPYAGYEDQELYYRMRHHGLKQMISGGSWIKHEGNGTIKPLLAQKPHLKKIMDNNAKLCLNDLKQFMKKTDA